MLPDAGKRWAVVLALGLFHGLYFAGFPAMYVTGAAIAQVVLILALSLAARKIPVGWRRAPGWGLLAAGLGWFGYRLVW